LLHMKNRKFWFAFDSFVPNNWDRDPPNSAENWKKAKKMIQK
jgi:hypothetical protein